MAKTVIALFDNTGRASDALNALRAAGFGDKQVEMLSAEEFLRRSELPAPEHERERLGPAIKQFFDEIGLTTPAPPPTKGEYYPIERDDAVILLEAGDDRADAAADVLDRHGAINIEERKKKSGTSTHRASGLEPDTSGRIPPNLREAEPYGDVDERTLASGRAGEDRRPRGARVY